MAGNSCTKCGGKMTEGFIPESRDTGGRISTWFEGKPATSWLGLKLRGRTKHAVVTMRCDKCGYLENYAPRT